MDEETARERFIILKNDMSHLTRLVEANVLEVSQQLRLINGRLNDGDKWRAYMTGGFAAATFILTLVLGILALIVSRL